MKIITIGSATRDCIIKSESFKVLKEGILNGKAECLPLGAKVELDELHFTTGGGGTNSACTFANQGLKTACLTKVGDDAEGKEVLSDLKKNNINTDLIKKSSLSTAFSVILLSEAGRTILVYRGASGDFKKEDFKEEEMKGDWFYITSLGGNLSFLEAVLNYSSKNGIKVALNPGSKEIKQKDKLRSLLDKVSILILNKEESLELSGREDINKAFKELSDSKIVVITKGKQGSEVVMGNKKFKAGIFQELKFSDSTGAGDAFGSGFVAGIINSGNDLEKEKCIKEGIRLGTANSASVIEHLGAKEKILTKEEFKKERWKNLSIKTSSL